MPRMTAPGVSMIAGSSVTEPRIVHLLNRSFQSNPAGRTTRSHLLVRTKATRIPRASAIAQAADECRAVSTARPRCARRGWGCRYRRHSVDAQDLTLRPVLRCGAGVHRDVEVSRLVERRPVRGRQPL